MTFSVRGNHIRIPLGVGIVAAILPGCNVGKVPGPQYIEEGRSTGQIIPPGSELRTGPATGDSRRF